MNQMQTCAEPPPPFLCMQDDCTSRSELMRNAVREAGASGGMCEPAHRQRRIIGSSWHKWHSCRGASGVSGGVSSFLFSPERKAKVCDVRNWPPPQLFTHCNDFTLGVRGGLKNICGWIVQPCLCETELVCRMTECVCHWQPRLHARAREQA